MAVDWHPSISDALATLSQQAGGIDVARAGYYPQVKAGIGSGRQNSQDTRQTASITASQMLYDFGKVGSSVDAAEAGMRRQQALVLRQIDDVAKQTAQAVVGVHRYQALQKIAQQQVAAIRHVMETAKLRAQAGISTQSDTLQARTRLEAAEANLLQVSSLLAQWRSRLQTLVGAPLPATVSDVPEALLQQAWREGQGEEVDVEQLPEVLAAEADRATAQAQLDYARAQRMPTLSLDAGFNKALGSGTVDGRRDSSHSLMLNVSSTLYQGGARSAQVQAAAHALQAALSRIDAARLNARDQVRAYREQITGLEGRLGVLAQRRRSIGETRELYEEQYKVGTRSILDVLNAEQEVHQAALDAEGARHDLWNSQVDYIHAIGQTRAVFALNHTQIQGLEIQP